MIVSGVNYFKFVCKKLKYGPLNLIQNKKFYIGNNSSWFYFQEGFYGKEEEK